MFVRNALIGMALGAGVLAYEDRKFGEDVFFVVTHDDPLVSTRLDPIMDPGMVSKHVHTIIGGSNFGPTVDYNRSIASECTTSNVDVDHSNYWVPQLYHKNDDDSLSLAKFGFAQTYYQMRRRSDKPVANDITSTPRDAEPVYEFPPGFRMLAGDPTRRTLDISDPAQDAIRYVCLGGNLEETHEFPTAYCPAGVRAQAYFPHCWDGVNNWLEGSKHVSYGSGRYDDGSECPATHPNRIMGLFYEFIFEDKLPYAPGKRVWSNGDDVGYSFHADFTNGWEEGFFTEVFSYGRECSVQFSLEDCPAFKGHVKKTACEYKGVTVVEDIGDTSPIAKFPGNNPGTSGYKETAKFSTGTPSDEFQAVIPAPKARLAPVKGDAPYDVPADALPQTGVVSSRTSQAAASMSAASTSAVASAYQSGNPAGSVTATRPATSVQATAIEAGASTSALPSVGGALIGQSGSASASLEAPAASSVTDVAAGASTSEIVPAPASSNVANRPAKGCGRGGRSRPHRSAA